MPKERQKSLERALEEAVSRALRDNLAPLQRTAESFTKPMPTSSRLVHRAAPVTLSLQCFALQTSASALAAGLSVLSNFVAVALKPRDSDDAGYGEHAAAEEIVNRQTSATAVEDAPESSEAGLAYEEPSPAPAAHFESHEAPVELVEEEEKVAQAEVVADQAAVVESQAFNVASLPPEIQDLHRRANRVAKVAMQDIKLLRPKDVKAAREHKDICIRLRSDLDKARKEYDRRFRAILEQPVDYFHHWMVEILAEGDSEALGEYPYPSPVLRH